MPLKQGTSDKTRSENIAEMVRAGHDPDQAAAAAYRQQRESKRKKAKDGLVAVTDADGHVWTRGVPLADNDTQMELEDGADPTRDGYLKANARVARVGTQVYRGYELGMPERERVTLYRPPEEVFARDSMRSHASKPITLTHPKRMVDKSTWGKVAKGFSGNEVVRDGEFVRVPLMLTDAAAIDAYQTGEARELSVGYLTDIDWTAGETPDGVAYDGVQRDIRTNHHALVPVARGGDKLRFGDAALGDYSEDQPRDEFGKWTAAEEAHFQDLIGQLRESQKKRGVGPPPKMGEINAAEYDDNEQNIHTPDTRFGPAPERPGKYRFSQAERPPPKSVKLAPGQEKNYRMDAADEADNAASRGTAEEGVMPVTRTFDGIPIQFADEVSAAAMEREYRRLHDAFPPNFKKKNGNGNGNGNGDDSDDDDVETTRKKVTAEDALKKDIATRDGEIAVLKKQLADAATIEAKVEAMAAERIALIDAAKPFLPKEFKDAGKSLADIRRAVVSTSFTDAEMKDWTDDQIIGAFRTMSKVGAGSKGGATAMADGLSAGMRSTAGYVGGTALADGEKQVNDAYADYVKRTTEAYRKPFEVVRN